MLVITTNLLLLGFLTRILICWCWMLSRPDFRQQGLQHFRWLIVSLKMDACAPLVCVHHPFVYQHLPWWHIIELLLLGIITCKNLVVRVDRKSKNLKPKDA